MIVDDSQIMLTAIKETFTGMGPPCDFIEAESDETAMVFLETRKIDLVLLDLNMSKISGINLLREVRAVDKELPIIVVSSEAAKYSVIEALKYGATDFIIKPVDAETLKNKLGKLDLFRETSP